MDGGGVQFSVLRARGKPKRKNEKKKTKKPPFIFPQTSTSMVQHSHSCSFCAQVLEHPRAKDGRVPSVVQNTLRALVAKVGLQAVRDAQLKNSRKDSHPEVDTLLHDVVKWHVSGWDR